MTTPNEEHDGYRHWREAALFWIRKGAGDLEALQYLEPLLPTFVRRRYRISTLDRRTLQGNVTLSPIDWETDDIAVADSLHADVQKLFDFMVRKVVDQPVVGFARPTREISYTGRIKYDFSITGLPGFSGGLDVTVADLPAGSACRIVKKVTANRVVQDYAYELVCDDDDERIPIEDAGDLATVEGRPR